MTYRAIDAYRRAGATADTPAARLDQAFARAIHDCHAAVGCIGRRDPAGKGTALNRVSDIVSQLECALDHERAPELCAHLQRVYARVQRLVGQTNVKQDAQSVRQAAEILVGLRCAFAEAQEAASTGKRPQANAGAAADSPQLTNSFSSRGG